MNPAYAIPFDPLFVSPGMMLLLSGGRSEDQCVGVTLNKRTTLFRGGAYLYLGQARVREGKEETRPILFDRGDVGVFVPSMVTIPLDHYLNEQAILTKVASALGYPAGYCSIRLVETGCVSQDSPIGPGIRVWNLQVAYPSDYKPPINSSFGMMINGVYLVPSDHIFMMNSRYEALIALMQQARHHIKGANHAGI